MTPDQLIAAIEEALAVAKARREADKAVIAQQAADLHNLQTAAVQAQGFTDEHVGKLQGILVTLQGFAD